MGREWQTSDFIGTVYELKRRRVDEIFNPPRGVVFFMCVEHTGDNHYEYRQLFQFGGHRWKVEKTFSKYGGGHPKAKWQPTKKEFYLLMGGMEVLDV